MYRVVVELKNRNEYVPFASLWAAQYWVRCLKEKGISARVEKAV